MKKQEENLSYKTMMSTKGGQKIVYKKMMEILEMFGKWKKDQAKKQEVDSARKKIKDV